VNNELKPVPKVEAIGDTAPKPTGKRNCPTGMAQNQVLRHTNMTVQVVFSDRAVIIGGLPSGQSVIVSVTARNPAGETLPTNATILVA